MASANQTAPCGATVSRPRRTIGVPSGKLEISPVGVMREIARALLSVYQALPSGPTPNPIGSTLLRGSGSRSISPLRTRPMAAARSIVNQIVPSGAAAIAVGESSGCSIRYSTKPAPDRSGWASQAAALPSTAAETAAPSHSRHPRRMAGRNLTNASGCQRVRRSAAAPASR